MFKTKGFITYTTKENPDQPITREVLCAYQQSGLYCISLKDYDNSPSEFIYNNGIKDNMFLIPDKEDEYGETIYKKFDGKILAFEYKTYWEED